MEVDQLQKRYLEYAASLFQEGFLDVTFTELQGIQNESSPSFLVELVSHFFRDSQKLQDDLTSHHCSPKVDFRKVEDYIHQLKGSSSSIGAGRVTDACVAFRHSCRELNTEACMRRLQQVQQEYALVQNKLETLFRSELKASTNQLISLLERQIVEAGGTVPRLDI